MSLLTDAVVIDLNERRPVAQVLLDKFIRWYSAGWVPTTADLKSASDDELELLIKAKTHVDSRERIFTAHANLNPVQASAIAEQSMEAAANADGKTLIQRANDRLKEMLARKGITRDAEPFAGKIGGEPFVGEKIVLQPTAPNDPVPSGDANPAQARVDLVNATA